MKSMLIALFTLWLVLGTAVVCHQNPPTQASPIASTPSAQEFAELRGRLQTLEQQMKDRSELFQQLNQFFWLITAIAGAGSVLTLLALFRDSLTKRERTISANDVKFSNALAQHTDKMVAAQIANVHNISGLIKFVHDAFDLQERQKTALDRLSQAQEARFTAQIEQLTKALNAENEREEDRKRREEERKRDANTKYTRVVGMMGTLDTTQALEWPSLPMHLLRLADHARIELENIPRDLLREIIATRPNEHASMLQRMGVAAYYDFYQIGIALNLLGEAESLFETAPADAAFNMARAYTQHFLAIIEKNWCLKGDTVGTNLDRAADRLRKAVAILGKDPNHFLTPVTLAEVLSYRDETEWLESCEQIQTLLDKVNSKGARNLDKNQAALHTRALLIRGNIEFRRQTARAPTEPAPTAGQWYDRAADTGSKNPYAWLSQARAMEPCVAETNLIAQEAADIWKKGYEALTQSEALRKQEMTQRVTAIAWAILAANRLGEQKEEARYREEFAMSGANKTIGGRFPLYFSPFKMTVVAWDDLAKDLGTGMS